MPMPRARARERGSDEGGMTTVQYAAATGLSLVVFVMLANLIVFLYARGVVRAAVDEAARTGGRAGATTAECEARARDVVDDLAGGGLAEIRVSCEAAEAVMRSRAEVTLFGWLPGIVPDWSFTLTGQSVKERER